jgi:hypothetical protein
LDLGCHTENLAPPMVFLAGRLGGRIFVLPMIPRVVSHIQIIDAVGGVGSAGHVEWDDGELWLLPSPSSCGRYWSPFLLADRSLPSSPPRVSCCLSIHWPLLDFGDGLREVGSSPSGGLRKHRPVSPRCQQLRF